MIEEFKPQTVFGDPDHCYEGPASLIIAVHAYPARFSEETHELVSKLVAEQVTVE